MASSSLLALAAAVTVLLSVHGATAATTLNFTDILVEGQQYTTFIRLLGQTQQITQIQNQLNNSKEGVTIFAPTDNAFNNLDAGALNNLNDQQKVSLIQFHVVPKFYTFATIQTASNPIRTQASSSSGVPYLLNFTSTSNRNQFNVSTGVNSVSVTNALNVTSPLAIYSIDAVLLPVELFGNKTASPPSTAPTSSATGAKAPAAGDTQTALGPSSGIGVRSIGWIGVFSVVMLGLM